jgi:hypothetical protein
MSEGLGSAMAEWRAARTELETILQDKAEDRFLLPSLVRLRRAYQDVMAAVFGESIGNGNHRTVEETVELVFVGDRLLAALEDLTNLGGATGP